MIDPPTPSQKGRSHPGTGTATRDSRAQDRQEELADFLRRLRERTSPTDAGLPDAGGRRRTPGLRREELAALSGISVDWYIRLEQGRAERPSPSVLDALARALRLSLDERSHLYALARGERPPLEMAAEESVDPGLERLLGAIAPEWPAYILGRRWDILAWNDAACDLLVDFGAVADEDRNLIALTFLDEGMIGRYVEWDLVSRMTLANFRGAAGRHVEDPDFVALVDRISEGSERFADLWKLHEVAEKSSGLKRFRGGTEDTFDMFYESVLSPTSADQRLIVYTRP